MKKILFFAAITLSLAACGSGNTTKVEVIDGVEVEVQTKRDTVSGQQSEYQQDIKTKALHGYNRIFHANGKVSQECQYRKGVKNGAEKIYYGSGKLKEEAVFVNGVYDGPAKSYYEDGKVEAEYAFVNDQREGEMKSYYQNGKLREMVVFKNSEENGAFKEYYEDGTIKTEGNYMSGKEHGLLLEYSEKGELLSKKKCRTAQCCTFWTLEKGDVKPANELCSEIISTTPDK